MDVAFVVLGAVLVNAGYFAGYFMGYRRGRNGR